MVEFDQLFRYKSTFFDKNWPFDLLINFFNLLIDFFNLLIDLFDLYINLLIEIDRIEIKEDWFYIEIMIDDSIPSLDFDLDRNRRSNLDFRFDSTTTIQFRTPNRISLLERGRQSFIVFWGDLYVKGIRSKLF